jgi:flagellar hook protein FlgE
MPVGDERKTSINIFDNNGGVHSITFSFKKSANANEFGVTAQVDGKNVNLSAATIKFNQDGTLNSPLSLSVKAADINTAIGVQSFDQTTPKDINIILDSTDNLTGGLTQYGGMNTATALKPDGYQAGDLQSLSVDQEGKVMGGFSNGVSEVLGQVVIAKFVNPGGLMKEGMNFLSVSPNSGAANVGTAGEIFQSTKITGQALEQSNVDLTTEFVNMITTQRAFEAASRVIRTGDAMLQEVTMLKR